VVLGPILLLLNERSTVYVPIAEVAPGTAYRCDTTGGHRHAPPAAIPQDAATYHVWQKTDTEGGPAGKYLVNDRGDAVWLVDPGINGTHKTRPTAPPWKSTTRRRPR
jgi:hypothetical protein